MLSRWHLARIPTCSIGGDVVERVSLEGRSKESGGLLLYVLQSTCIAAVRSSDPTPLRLQILLLSAFNFLSTSLAFAKNVSNPSNAHTRMRSCRIALLPHAAPGAFAPLPRSPGQRRNLSLHRTTARRLCYTHMAHTISLSLRPSVFIFW